ncbi:hypothetical protein FRB95_011333 [Tulasnella sp. JGI-2019a]|nr:hypothetical protein FRB95_011333 [Tulasnella sp. JGI-2019a]
MMSTTYTEGEACQLEEQINQHITGIDPLVSAAAAKVIGRPFTGFTSLNAEWSAYGATPEAVFCHNQRLGPLDKSCTAVPTSLLKGQLTLAWTDGSQTQVWFSSHGNKTWSFTISDFEPNLAVTVISDAMQFLLAAVRLDIGNVFPNNFLVYPSTMDAIVSKGSDIRLALAFDKYYLPSIAHASRPAVIASQYLCHLPQRKPLGSVFVSVLVATLSMFSSAWAVFLVVATYYGNENTHKVIQETSNSRSMNS